MAISEHFTYNVSLSDGCPFIYQKRTQFQEAFAGDMVRLSHKGHITCSLYDFLSSAKQAANALGLGQDARIEMLSPMSSTITVGNRFLISITYSSSVSNDAFKEADMGVTVTCFGAPESCRAFGKDFLVTVKPSFNPQVQWFFLSGSNLDCTTTSLQPCQPMNDDMYPWMEGGLDSYIDGYLASQASLLILLGPPGTGKTSFIRRLIWRAGSNAMLTYEERLFHSDPLFVKFMNSPGTAFLIMEDADLMLSSRESAGNGIMNKFLNITDGLFRMPGKKVVMSANIVDKSRIDEALVRPGRCYDVPVFRRLSRDEAQQASRGNANMELPGSGDAFSLAEMFKNGSVGRAKAKERPRFGFGLAA